MKWNMGVVALFVLGLIAVTGTVAAVGFGGMMKDNTAEQEAIEAGDFIAWKTAVMAQLTEENFNSIVEWHKNRPEGVGNGKGFGEGMGVGMGSGNGRGPVDPEQMDALRQAVEDGDYDAYTAAAETMGADVDRIMAEEDFDLLVQLHAARDSGDPESIESLEAQLEENGIGGAGMGLFGNRIRPDAGNGPRMGKGIMQARGDCSAATVTE